MSSKGRIKTRAQRVAARVAYDGFTTKTARLLAADNGYVKIAIMFLTALFVGILCQAWDPPTHYKLGMIPARSILSRANFSVVSPDLTESEKQETRLRTLRYYRNDPSKLDDFEGEIINGLLLILEAPDYQACQASDVEFLTGFLPPTATEEAVPRAFEILKQYFGDDDELARFRSILEATLDQYRANGVVRRFDSARNVQSDDSDAKDPGKSNADQDDPFENQRVKIRVYDKGSDPASARVVAKSATLLGDGSKIKTALRERIEQLEIVNLVSNKIRNSIPDTLEWDAVETFKAQDLEEQKVREQEIEKSQGDLLVKAGANIDEYALRLLNAERQKVLQSRPARTRCIRFIAFVALIFIQLFGAFTIFHNKILTASRSKKIERGIFPFIVFLSCFIFFIGLGRVLQLSLQNGSASPELIPLLIFTQLTAIATSWEVAITFGSVAAVTLSLTSIGGLNDFIVFFVAVAVVSILSRSIRTRTQLFVVAFAAAVATFGASLATELANDQVDRSLIDSSLRGVWAFLAGFITAGMLPIFERVFGLLTPMRLLEYSNPSHPLLLELNRRAPATYSHAIQTAALVEPAAEAIGADSALARVGAYFHDVGKMLQPEHFTENQKGYNIHNELEPRMSALVIVAHVKDGVNLAERYKLPRQVVDLIEQHHGTMLVGFFYKKAKEIAEAKDSSAPPLDESPFRYPGPIPQTKEAAVLMLADAFESASRSLVDWTPRRVENLAHKLAEQRIEDGQFNECGLTLGEIRVVEQSLVSTMLASKHERVRYPSEKESTISEKSEKEDKARSSDGSSNVKRLRENSGIVDSSSIIRKSFGSFDDAQQK